MKTGNTVGVYEAPYVITKPQWSPVMKTGNTRPSRARAAPSDSPQWSPVMKTGNTSTPGANQGMSPGLNGARS